MSLYVSKVKPDVDMYVGHRLDIADVSSWRAADVQPMSNPGPMLNISAQHLMLMLLLLASPGHRKRSGRECMLNVRTVLLFT